MNERRLPLKRRPLPKKPVLRPFVAYDFETDPIPRVASDKMKPGPRYLTMYGPGVRVSRGCSSIAEVAALAQEHLFAPRFARWRFVGWNSNRFDVYFLLDAIVEHLPDLIVDPYVAGTGVLRGARVRSRSDSRLWWELLDGMAMTGQQCRLSEFIATFAPAYAKMDGSGIVTDFRADDPRHRAYAERDAEGLWHALAEVESILVRLTGRGLCATIGKVGIQFFASRLPDDVLVWRPRDAHLEVIREHVVRGGYVACRRQYEGPGFKFDLNQAYLGIGMRDTLLPAGNERSTDRFVPQKPGVYHVNLWHEREQPVGFYCSMIEQADPGSRTVYTVARALLEERRAAQPENPLAGVRVSPLLVWGDERLADGGARRISPADRLGRAWWVAGEFSCFKKSQLFITPAQRKKMESAACNVIEGNLDQLAASAGVSESRALELLAQRPLSIADVWDEALQKTPARSRKGVTRGEPVQTWLTSIEWETLARWGWQLELLPGSWYWSEGFSMRTFVDELEAARMSCPGGPAGPTGTMLKAIGVNAYGKTGERIPLGRTVIAATDPSTSEQRYVAADVDDERKKFFWWEIVLESQEPDERVYHRPQLAAFITAAVRMELFERIMQAPDAFIACDTDSLLFDRDVDHLPLHPSRYGAYKIEAAGTPFIVVGKKAYMDVAKGRVTYKGLRTSEISPEQLRAAMGPQGVSIEQRQIQLQGWKRGLGSGSPMYAAATRKGTDFARHAPETLGGSSPASE